MPCPITNPSTGLQVTAVARQAFRRAVIEAEPRLVEAMFLCEVAAASDVLSGEHPAEPLHLGRSCLVMMFTAGGHSTACCFGRREGTAYVKQLFRPPGADVSSEAGHAATVAKQCDPAFDLFRHEP